MGWKKSERLALRILLRLALLPLHSRAPGARVGRALEDFWGLSRVVGFSKSGF
jgi:hypothetical protein